MKSAGRWPTAVIALALVLLAALFGTSPAGAVPMAAATTGYEAATFTYDASAQLSTQNVAATCARGSPVGPGAASWERSAFIRGCCSAAEAGKAAGAPAHLLKVPIADAVPRNLAETMALDTARQGYGQQIMGTMSDAPRLIANYGEGAWVKMQYVLRGNNSNVTVHYFRNLDTLLDVEFKIP